MMETIKGLAYVEGFLTAMAAVMQDNLGGQLTILKSQLQELAISFGEMLMPAIRAIVSRVQTFVDKLNGMSESQRNTILRIGMLVAALGPFLVILGTCISKVGIAMQGFVKLAGSFGKLKVAVGNAHGVLGKIGAALGGVSAPVLAVVAVIAVLVAAFLHLWKTNEGFREAIIGTWNKIKSTISTFVEGIKQRLSALGFSFSDVANFIRLIWEGLCQFLGPIFIGAFNAIAVNIETILGVITGIFDVFSGLFTGNWDLLWQGVSEIFSSIWNGITGTFTNVTNTMKNVLNVFLSFFGTNITNVLNAVKAVVVSVLSYIRSFFSNAWSSIRSTTSSVWNSIKSAIVQPIESARDAVRNAIDKIKGFMDFEWSLPHLKLPHISVSGSANPLDWLKGSVPHFSVDWYKTGGIFNSPSIIGVGEAGSEAVLPLDAFYSYMDRAVNRIIAASSAGGNAAVIYEAVKAGMQDADIGISLNGREFGRTLKGMGVSLT